MHWVLHEVHLVADNTEAAAFNGTQVSLRQGHCADSPAGFDGRAQNFPGETAGGGCEARKGRVRSSSPREEPVLFVVV